MGSRPVSRCMGPGRGDKTYQTTFFVQAFGRYVNRARIMRGSIASLRTDVASFDSPSSPIFHRRAPTCHYGEKLVPSAVGSVQRSARLQRSATFEDNRRIQPASWITISQLGRHPPASRGPPWLRGKSAAGKDVSRLSTAQPLDH